jgi:prevent-host-death family protein
MNVINHSFDSLDSFTHRPKELVARVKEETPLVLTVEGEAKLVVQDADAYANLLKRAEQQETVEALRVGIQAADEGRIRPLTQLQCIDDDGSTIRVVPVPADPVRAAKGITKKLSVALLKERERERSGKGT